MIGRASDDCFSIPGDTQTDHLHAGVVVVVVVVVVLVRVTHFMVSNDSFLSCCTCQSDFRFIDCDKTSRLVHRRLKMPSFLIYVKAVPGAWDAFSVEEQREFIARYADWARELKEQDVLKDGSAVDEQFASVPPLDTAGARRAPAREMDGLVLTAIFRIVAEDFDEAVKVAETCPARGHGEYLCVQPLSL